MPHRHDTPSYDIARAYWRELLQNFTPSQIPMLLEGSPTTQYDFQEASVNVHLKGLATSQLRAQTEITLHSVFQIAWAVVVACYAGTEDVSFGCFVTHGSSPSDAESMDLILCRTKITADCGLFQTMAQMAKQIKDSLQHRSCSIEEIRQFPELEGKSLFNSVLHVQHDDRSRKAGSLTFGQGMRNDPSVGYDILARVQEESDNHFTISVRTRTSKFSSPQTVDLAHTWEKILLESLKGHWQSTIGDLDVLSGRDFEKIVSWNGPTARSVDICVHRYFEDVAQMTPDAPAVCANDGDLTYRELNELANTLCKRLISLGVVPEMPVPFCFNKSAAAIVAILGILKAGGAFVAVDPTFPSSRIHAIVEATKATVAVVEPAHAHLFEKSVEHVVVTQLDSINEPSVLIDGATMLPNPTNAAYIVFTSGSTGAPKGIVVEHRALSTAVLSLAGPMQITSRSRVLQFAAYTFDASIGDIFITLLQGGCICVPSEYERMNELAGAIVRMKVTAACLTPSVVRVLHPDEVPCLKSISCGGEMLLQEIVARWAGKVALVNVYGPSECTIWCTAHTQLRAQSSPSNIGRALEARVWVTRVNNQDYLCPVGCIGELLIEGPVLARGYLNPEQTKRAFVVNPSWACEDPNEPRRFYKTGDLVRYNCDGTLNFVGRKDTQVKVHGYRIELGEIEHHLSQHELIRQSMVIYPTAGRYNKQLVGMIVFKNLAPSKSLRGTLKLVTGSGEPARTTEVTILKKFLHSKLPSYMVPQHWFIVEDIPLIASGKLDRVLARRMVEGAAGRPAEETSFPTHEKSPDLSFSDPVMTQLRDIWSSVFNKSPEEISFGQDFGSLGGDSLMAMDLVARCKIFGITITVGDVLKNDTIRQLTLFIKKTSAKQKTARIQSQLMFGPTWWDNPR